MQIQQRLIRFITRANWVLFAAASIFGMVAGPSDFAFGIICGGFIVTLNFHLLSRTLRKALKPPHLVSPNVVLVKYYIRFIASGFVICTLIIGKVVNPIGLVVGLSVVVASIMLASIIEAKKILCKEAV